VNTNCSSVAYQIMIYTWFNSLVLRIRWRCKKCEYKLLERSISDNEFVSSYRSISFSEDINKNILPVAYSWWKIVLARYWFKVDYYISMISYDILWCLMMSYDILWYLMMSYDILWCLMMSYDILWCLMISYDVVWYFMISYDTTS
jgi:hypothetical protein